METYGSKHGKQFSEEEAATSSLGKSKVTQLSRTSKMESAIGKIRKAMTTVTNLQAEELKPLLVSA